MQSPLLHICVRRGRPRLLSGNVFSMYKRLNHVARVDIRMKRERGKAHLEQKVNSHEKERKHLFSAC